MRKSFPSLPFIEKKEGGVMVFGLPDCCKPSYGVNTRYYSKWVDLCSVSREENTKKKSINCNPLVRSDEVEINKRKANPDKK